MDLTSLSSLKPVAPQPSPIEKMKNLLALKEGFDQNQITVDKLEEAHRTQQQQAQLHDILSNAEWDPETGSLSEKTLRRIDEHDPILGANIRKEYQGLATSRITAKKDQTAADSAQFDFNQKKAGEQKFQEYYSGYLTDNKLPKNAANEQKARFAYKQAGEAPVKDTKLDELYRGGHRILRMQRPDNSTYEIDDGTAEAAPRAQTPGVDVPYSDEVEKQKERIARTGKADDAAVTLTPQSLDIVARRYLQDGTLPPMGNGAQGSQARSRIINRASEIDPDAAVAANAANYRALSASQTALQKNQTAVAQFENTARKNLQQFIATAKKVRDTGSPWINRGLRSIDRTALGSVDQAAYDAARQVAFTEIARVVSNPSLAGVLSDSARQEMEKIMAGDATLAQTLRAAEILTQDMDNRKTAIAEEMASIKEQLRDASKVGSAGIGQSGGATPPRAPKSVDPLGIR
jgi:hypothetical protein